MKKFDKEIDNKEVNEVVSLTKKILKLLYIVMIVAIVLCGTIILKNLNVWHLLFTFLKVLSPLFIGFVIAWLLNPIVTKMHKKGIPRIVGSLLVYTVFLVFIYIFLRILIPTLYTQINDLIATLPAILDKFKSFISDFIDQVSISGVDLTSFKDNIFASVGNYLVNFTNSLPDSIIGILGSLASGIGTILISLVVGLYMLFDFDAIATHFLKLVPNKNKYEIEVLLTDIGIEVRKTVSGTLLVALMVFICDTIGFAMVGLNAPLLFGIFCGLTDLIPYIGPYIGGAAAVIVGFSQGSFTGIAVLIICVIVQLVENYILQPIVMSKTTQLHPVTIIVGLLVFAYYFGIVGMIIATPCIALLKVIFRFIVKKYDLFKDDEVLLKEVLKS
ncbi:MAG: AI-2E family transporter [Bacilli bacterium]|jgi:predicted PurR-regulated permease PerM|nr:AI-2E family transporter [Bacilli bacterium]MCX4254045.1 AI-2E family transporter [Bacilli bacterium]